MTISMASVGQLLLPSTHPPDYGAGGEGDAGHIAPDLFDHTRHDGRSPDSLGIRSGSCANVGSRTTSPQVVDHVRVTNFQMVLLL